MTNEDTTDFDEHFAKISSYIVDTLHGVPLEMTEDEKEQFRIQVISNQYAERLLSEAEKTETYRGLSKIDILHTVSIPQLARTIPLKGLNLSLEKYRIYIISLVSLKPSSLQRVLTELQWNGMWFFSLAFFAVIFMEMLSDFLLVTDCCTAWKALNGNVSEAEFHNLQQIVLCENQKVSIEKKLASTILLVLMICATAAFVWFTFWYKVLL